MKKKVLFILIIMIILLVLTFVFLFNYDFLFNHGEENEILKCVSDSDCVKVQMGCCPCNMGGEEKCVLDSESSEYAENLKNCSEKILCPAVFLCKIESCRCINGGCGE